MTYFGGHCVSHDVETNGTHEFRMQSSGVDSDFSLISHCFLGSSLQLIQTQLPRFKNFAFLHYQSEKSRLVNYTVFFTKMF